VLRRAFIDWLEERELFFGDHTMKSIGTFQNKARSPEAEGLSANLSKIALATEFDRIPDVGPRPATLPISWPSLPAHAGGGYGRRQTHMTTNRIIAAVVLTVAMGLALPEVQAENAGPVGLKRTDLMKQDLSVAGREVVQVLIDFAPGAMAPRHSHPGEELVYIVEGSLEYALEGKSPVTLKVGQVLFIPHGTIHAVKNVGGGNARELATYVVEKGKPLLKLAE
jgi:quercetin dioxygenase-like cupin family protein